MAPSWALPLLLCGFAHGNNLQLFTQLGNNSDKEACRTAGGLSSQIGDAYWQATGIPTVEQCATLCVEVLNDCRGFEYQNMSSATAGRCEIWMENVTSESVPSFADPLYCYSRTTPANNTNTPQFVSLTLNFTGINTSTVNDTILTAMTQAIKSEFSTHLSGLANRPDVNISESDVETVIMNCETVAIVITKPSGTNLIPIYESLSYYNSVDNVNQGSKRVALRTAINTALAPYGLNFPHNEHNSRAIGNIAGKPSSSSTCTTENDDVDQITVDAAQSTHIGVLAMLALTVFFGF